MIRKCNSVAPTPWLSDGRGLLFFFHYFIITRLALADASLARGFSSGICPGLIYLVYTPHRAIGSAEIFDRTTSLMIHGRFHQNRGAITFHIWHDGLCASYPAVYLLRYRRAFLTTLFVVT